MLIVNKKNLRDKNLLTNLILNFLIKKTLL